MRLHAVTITGADDNTSVRAMRELSGEYPFLEWGILLTGKRDYQPRCPSEGWIASLDLLAADGVRFSGHASGWLARKISEGMFPAEVQNPIYSRLQLNIGPKLCKVARRSKTMMTGLPMDRHYIIQFGRHQDASIELTGTLQGAGYHISVLFDVSGGRGLSPKRWPAPLAGVECGYAGGLGPDNIAEELESITAAAGDACCWVDMESRVRADDDDRLDLDKVIYCLEAAANYVRSNHTDGAQELPRRSDEHR